MLIFFFFNDTATTEIYTLSLHDALPIWATVASRAAPVVWPSTNAATAASLRHWGVSTQRDGVPARNWPAASRIQVSCSWHSGHVATCTAIVESASIKWATRSSGDG